MLKLFQTVSLIAATTSMGLMAGLFAAFSYAVMPGLARTGDRTFVEAVQRINAAILNGWFAIGFAGAIVFTGVAAALHLGADHRAVLPWLLAAFVLYAAVLAITFGINIPLNDAIDAAGDVDRVPDLAAVRAAFEGRWVRWNAVRAVLSTAALACLGWALIRYGRTM
ncbi:MAG TPA: anthrone oxygenase family protein [Thermomonospora sp.]|nr:anthrone oxygenase family protein [Thermomonospora sp.]